MAKNPDTQVLMKTILECMEEVLSKMTGIVATSATDAKENDIQEYYGRLRVDGVSKFQAPSYISVINYYLNESDMKQRGKAKGAMIVYMDVENSGKFFKALGIKFPDDEDDASMMNCNGEFCNLLGASFKKKLAELGYANLAMSAPVSYRNSILDGVEYSQDQKKILEFNSYYFKKKSIVVELTMADLPMKR